ncbi:hypothetical protein [Candidatus Ichthyocystis hellenicum]|uniref:hypothetical protein n=1 Tax=Candidatus Ichthyocystis hellenicum TaxID=1561003 RepID=UPI000B89F553|nr:hypothetical protein [Candidatus Ichthyocystis hellenicum]
MDCVLSNEQHCFGSQDFDYGCPDKGDGVAFSCDKFLSDKYLFKPLAVTGFSATASVIPNSTETDVLSSSYQSLECLCAEYGYNSNFETILEFCDESFLQVYATKCGYKFTEYFLSTINKHKTEFVEKVDSILTSSLCGSFNFFKDPNNIYINIVNLMDKVCSSFSICIYELRPKCINFLQSEIIPITIKVIFDSKVISGECERKMTYMEMEQLFLHFVTTLEKLIMVRVMKSWCCFCNENKALLSMISGIDYSNPFARAYYYEKISAPNITHPAAFTSKFGKYVSFMAVAKINEIIGNFVDKYYNEFREVIRYKCSYICNYSDNAVADLRKLRNELRNKTYDLIEEEFCQKMVEEGMKDNFSCFLSSLLIWNKNEIMEEDRLLTFDNVICCVRNFLVDNFPNDVYKVIVRFQKSVRASRNRVLNGGTHFRTIKDRWGVNLHPEDNYKISSIRGRFYKKSRDIIHDKFSAMLREKYKFSDGTVIGIVDWDKISKNIFPIAQETVRSLLDEVRADLSNLLLNVRILEDTSVFDGYYSGTRVATSEERNSILKLAIQYIYRHIRDSFRKIWRNLIDSEKNNASKHTDLSDKLVFFEKVSDSCENSTLMYPAGSGDLLVCDYSVNNEISAAVSVPVNSSSLDMNGDKIISRWGLNLHPDDDRLIMFIRRKFTNKISDRVRVVFSDMLERGSVLPSGVVLHNCSWSLVSGELFPIAIKSIKFILEDEYSELDRVLSKARVVDVDGYDASSCVIRKITDDEKNNLMAHAKTFIYRGLRYSIRLLWSDVSKTVDSTRYYSKKISEYTNDRSTVDGDCAEKFICSNSIFSHDRVKASTKYGYKGISRDIDEDSIVEGSWGVKLRYDDNLAILNARKERASKMRTSIWYKFRAMINDKYKFEDGTVIGRFTWFKMSKKLSPIARKEVKHILDDERKALEDIVSRARVVVDSTTCRELTTTERLFVLGNINKLVDSSLKSLCSKVWLDVLFSLDDTFSKVGNYLEEDCTDDNYGVTLSYRDLTYDDGRAILSVRKKFSYEISCCLRKKFIEMIKNKYEFEDGTVIHKSHWKYVSRSLFPIIRGEISPIIEKERMEISEMLLRARVVIYEPDGCNRVREITPRERFVILEAIMKSVHRQASYAVGRVWDRLIKSLDGDENYLKSGVNYGSEVEVKPEPVEFYEDYTLIELPELMDKDKVEFDNIRLEFIGNLGPIICEVVNSLLSNVDISPLVPDAVSSAVIKRSDVLFREGGFLNRVRSLLSCIQVSDLWGGSRFLTSSERKYFFRNFMDSISNDRCYLVEKRTREFNSVYSTVECDSSAGVYVDSGEDSHSKHKISVSSENNCLGYDHSYAKT